MRIEKKRGKKEIEDEEGRNEGGEARKRKRRL